MTILDGQVQDSLMVADKIDAGSIEGGTEHEFRLTGCLGAGVASNMEFAKSKIITDAFGGLQVLSRMLTALNRVLP